MNDNIKRAQILRLNNEQHARLTMIRFNHSEPFKVIAIDDRISRLNTQWSMEDVRKHGQRIEILAEFPLSLADLLPEGCTAFHFKSAPSIGFIDTAVMDEDGLWEVAGEPGDYDNLDALTEHFRIDLNTVIPLELRIHPQYVEERR